YTRHQASLHITLFLFNNSPPTEYYTLSLHDALPISSKKKNWQANSKKQPLRHGNSQSSSNRLIFMPAWANRPIHRKLLRHPKFLDRKSTRLNSSHVKISYAVFCLKKKKNKRNKVQSH